MGAFKSERSSARRSRIGRRLLNCAHALGAQTRGGDGDNGGGSITRANYRHTSSPSDFYRRARGSSVKADGGGNFAREHFTFLGAVRFRSQKRALQPPPLLTPPPAIVVISLSAFLVGRPADMLMAL